MVTVDTTVSESFEKRRHDLRIMPGAPDVSQLIDSPPPRNGATADVAPALAPEPMQPQAASTPCKKVLIIIPCFNEESSIADVIDGIPKDGLAHTYDIDVLVIDNNSSDNTAAIAKQMGARLVHEPLQGKGNAIRTAFRNLGDADYVVMLDGDNTYRPEELGRVLEPLNSGFCDVVIGSRLCGRIEDGSMTMLNRVGNWIYSHLVRYSYHVNVTDVLTGYFAWKREVVDGLLPHLQAEGFAIEMEMITKMARLGNDIYSVPISYHSRDGESTLSPLIDGARIFKTYVANLRWRPTVLDAPHDARRDR